MRCYESRVAGPPWDYSYSCRDSTLLSTLCPYHGRRVTGVFQSDKINFHLDVWPGRAEAIMSYVQILDHLDQQEQQEDLFKFRAITGHEGPLSPQDENYKGSKYNVMVEWETGEITDEPLSLIAADDPVTCAEYAKKHDLLHLDGWKKLKHIAKNQKQLTRAINQSKIRQVRRSAVYQFGFLIPKD